MSASQSRARQFDEEVTGARHDLSLVVDDLGKTYGTGSEAHEVLRGLMLRVDPGEIVCIVGPSGVGKTTLLRCLSGLMPPSSGAIRLGETALTGPAAEIGLVFQDYSRSLLPWMRVNDNVAFPLQGIGVRKERRIDIANRVLASVGLDGFQRRYPWQLSGGMQQRVAIARALAYRSEVIVMDEPFASVDAQTRFDLEDLVLDLRARIGISIVLVTHDIDEAVYLADRVVVLSGRPATVVDTIDVPFGRERDQFTTKARPEFAELRNRILAEIGHRETRVA